VTLGLVDARRARLPSEYGWALVRGSTIVVVVVATFGVACGSV
jgi:hypothetical protein